MTSFRSCSRHALGVVVVAAVVASNAGSVRADEAAKARIVSLLSGYEGVPGPSTWRALGPSTLSTLMDVYADQNLMFMVRVRAVAVSAYFPTHATHAFLLSVVNAPRQNELFVREALLADQRAFGDHALEDLVPSLSHSSPIVRRAAVIGLGRIGTEGARQALSRALATEQTDFVRASIVEALDGRTP